MRLPGELAQNATQFLPKEGLVAAQCSAGVPDDSIDRDARVASVAPSHRPKRSVRAIGQTLHTQMDSSSVKSSDLVCVVDVGTNDVKVQSFRKG